MSVVDIVVALPGLTAHPTPRRQPGWNPLLRPRKPHVTIDPAIDRLVVPNWDTPTEPLARVIALPHRRTGGRHHYRPGLERWRPRAIAASLQTETTK